jgi:group I intron endonuclease
MNTFKHYSGIYQITNVKNGKFYIGSAKDFSIRKTNHFCRFKNNLHHSKQMQNAYNKYGENIFEFKILLICDIENLIFYEQLCIDKFKPPYNFCKVADSKLGTRHSEETKEKIRRGVLGRKNTDETKHKMSLAQRGHIMSEDAKRKLSEKAKGRKGHHSKLTKEQAMEIFLSKEKYRILASKFGVKILTIYRIKANKTWKWFTNQVKDD